MGAYGDAKKKTQLKPRFGVQTQKGASTADYGGVDAKLLQRAIAAWTSTGGALRLGYTSDGGAYAIGVYGDGDPYTIYCKPEGEIEDVLNQFAESGKS